MRGRGEGGEREGEMEGGKRGGTDGGGREEGREGREEEKKGHCTSHLQNDQYLICKLSGLHLASY